jgi:hypothetical protein
MRSLGPGQILEPGPWTYQNVILEEANSRNMNYRNSQFHSLICIYPRKKLYEALNWKARISYQNPL